MGSRSCYDAPRRWSYYYLCLGKLKSRSCQTEFTKPLFYTSHEFQHDELQKHDLKIGHEKKKRKKLRAFYSINLFILLN